MKLILTALFSEGIVSALKDQSYFTVSEGLNSFSQRIHIISYSSGEHLSQKRTIEAILPTLKALQAVFVNDFIQAIKNQNITGLIAATMQLRAFISYCNDLAEKIDTEKWKNKSSELLALAKAEMINNEYAIFPENENGPNKQLSVDDAKRFSLQYYSLTSLKNDEYRTLQEKHNDEETPLPEKAKIFGESYTLLTMFMTLSHQKFISKLPSDKEARQAKYSYEQFCSYVDQQETLSERLPHRYLIQAFNILSKSPTSVTDQISALTDVYEAIKNNTEEDNSAVREYLLQFTSKEDQKLIYERVNAIKQTLSRYVQNPSDKNCTRYAAITQEYINELTHTLTFLEFFKSEDSNNSAFRKNNINQIENVLKSNIESLEDLAGGLKTYHNDSKGKSTERKKFADDLVTISKNSTLSARQRVINIKEKINTPSNKTESGLLEKCWNVLKRIGNAAKGLWHYRNEIKKNAHFEKAANPHESVSLYELKYGSFFPAAEKLGVIKNETNSLR